MLKRVNSPWTQALGLQVQFGKKVVKLKIV